MDRPTKHLFAVMGLEFLVIAALGYLAFVAEAIDVMTLAYAAVGLSIVTTPLVIRFARRHEEADVE